MFRRLRRRFFPTKPLKTLSSMDAYQRWAANYPPQAHNPLMQAEESAMLRLIPDLSGRVVLDLACGTGRYARLALERGAKVVIGLDNSMAMLTARGSVNWQAGLATSEAIPLASESVDVILCGLALGHLPRLDSSMQEMGRVLKRGGWALVSDFHPFLYLNGGRRTFTASEGQTYAVEHYVHLYADYHRVAGEAGLNVERVLEPGLSDESKSPVVIVFRLGKI